MNVPETLPGMVSRRCGSAHGVVALKARQRRNRTPCSGEASRGCACSARDGQARLHNIVVYKLSDLIHHSENIVDWWRTLKYIHNLQIYRELPEVVNELSQNLQVCGLTPLCMFTWFCSEACVLNPRSHTLHLWGRSSEWHFMWRSNRYLFTTMKNNTKRFRFFLGPFYLLFWFYKCSQYFGFVCFINFMLLVLWMWINL